MSAGRIVLRIIVIFVCSGLGMSALFFVQTKRADKRVKKYISIAQIAVAAGSRADVQGTLVSAETRLRALDRVRILNPELREHEVTISVASAGEKHVLNVTATCADPAYAKAFLNALVDEYVGFESMMRTADLMKELVRYRQELAESGERVRAAQTAFDTIRQRGSLLEMETETGRLSGRLVKLRNQRDALSLDLKTDAGNTAAVTKLSVIEKELADVESGFKKMQKDLDGLKQAESILAEAKSRQSEAAQKNSATERAIEQKRQEIIIQQRACPAAEIGGDQKLPVVVGTICGGLIGALVGLLLALLLVRQPQSA